MYERAVEKMLPVNGLKYTIRNYKNTQNIKYVPESGCLITVGTAVEPDSVRSDDVKMAHLSEMAYYPNTENNNPELTEATITSSIPEEPYTLIGRETTANGMQPILFHLNISSPTTSFSSFFIAIFSRAISIARLIISNRLVFPFRELHTVTSVTPNSFANVRVYPFGKFVFIF